MRGNSVLGAFVFYGALQILGSFIAVLLAYVVVVVMLWKIFKKAGEAGWKALIPFYNLFILFRIAWSTKWFWYLLGASVATIFGGLIPLIGPTILVASAFIVLFTCVFGMLQLAKAFGKDEAWGIGLTILAPVFLFILAFDQDVKYVGAQSDPKFFSTIKSDIKAEIDDVKRDSGREKKFDPYTGKPLFTEPSIKETVLDSLSKKPIIDAEPEVKETVDDYVDPFEAVVVEPVVENKSNLDELMDNLENEIDIDEGIQVIKPGELK